MTKPKDAKVWNEILTAGLQARADQARAQGRQTQYVWRDGAAAIQAVRGDIYCFANGRIVGLPLGLKVTVDNEARAIIRGERPIFPPGWKCTNRHQQQQQQQEQQSVGVDYSKDPYLKRIKMRGGAYAILLAFHYSSASVMTKDQICQAAQEYCDEPMEANVFAGRNRGAWNSKGTLVKHGLLMQHTHHRGGGAGCWTYSITENGTQFTKAMMQKFNLQEDGLGQQETTLSTDTARSTNTPPSPPGKAKSGRTLVDLQNKDRKELLEWIETADVDEQKMFQVGQQRRATLHEMCTQLMKAWPGQLLLDHVSEGTDNNPIVYITLRHKSHTLQGLSSSNTSLWGRDNNNNRLVTPTSPASKRTSSSEPSSTEPSLDTSPTKKPRAAANAKSVHAAIVQTQLEREPKKESQMKKASLWERIQSSTYLLESSSDSDSDLADLLGSTKKPKVSKPRKLCMEPSGNPPTTTLLPKSQPSTKADPEIVEIIDESSEEEDNDSDTSASYKSRTKQLHHKSKACPTLAVKKASLNEPVVLDDSFESLPSYCSESRETTSAMEIQPAATIEESPLMPNLSILIDSRERDRNATPRQMRMDLTRHVTSGLLSRVWPHNMPMVDVVEKCLLCGDFAFEIQKNQLVKQRLPLAIERKRISDLVQRSAKGDHWKQFQAMCSYSDDVTFLLEGDTSCAQQFSADCAQNLEDECNPDSYLIDDDDSIFLFMGRALLNSRKTRFIQT
jgi:hypothetical protein